MREHVLDEMVKNDPEVKAFVKNNQHLLEKTINPRDSLYGGRTHAI